MLARPLALNRFSMQKLPSALISLVHHVQLNQSGWWNAAIERLILATLWTANGTLQGSDLPTEIRRLYDVSVGSAPIDGAIQRLKNRGEVVATKSGALKITEARMAELQDERSAADRLVASVQAIFRGALEREGLVTPEGADASASGSTTVDAQQAWDAFESLWLQPTVCTAGARTYELINGDYSQWTRAKDLDEFLGQFPEETHGQLNRALEHFLDPGNADVRAFILRLMDGYFVVEASQLEASTVSRLSELSGQHPTFTVFLDTNFLLSLLGVHDEGAQAAAEALVQLPSSLEGRVNVRLQVLGATMDETRSALQREMRAVEHLRMTAPLAKTALKTTELTGMAGALLRAAAKSEQTLTAKSMFEPYVQSLTAILKKRGITVSTASLAEIKRRSDVIADIDAQLAAQDRSPGTRPKARLQVEHDVALWHYVNGQRPTRVDTPSDAGVWIVTEDGRFAAFDAYKQGASGVPTAGRIPICLQPLGLVQILQFWLGRSARVEEALVGAFRLSMLSRSFDPASEHATITILQAISRFENVDDLTPDAITHLLMNSALRTRLGQVENVSQREQLVRDELLSEFRRLSDEVERARKAQPELDARLAVERAASDKAVREERERRVSAEGRLTDSQVNEQRLSGRVASLESREARRDFRTKWVALPLVLAAALVVVTIIYMARNSVPYNWRIGVPIFLVGSWVWTAFLRWKFKGDDTIGAYWLYRAIARAQGLIAAFVVGISYGVLGNLATDGWWKPLTQTAQPAIGTAVSSASDSSRGDPATPAPTGRGTSTPNADKSDTAGPKLGNRR